MVERGAIRFHDAVQPALDAGMYRFDVSIAGSAQTDPFRVERFVSVEAPRYRIEESDLFTAQPMPGSRSEVTGQIPWVALRRRTLPWERRGPIADQTVPWLALIVTRADEASLVDAATLADLIGPSAAAAFGTPPDGPYGGLVFASPAALRSFVPTPADARLLTHVREVSLTDTELGGDDDDGWVAVVAANRVLPGNPTADEVWRATLVSLEHRDDVAAGQPETAALLALATWTFTDVAGVSFATSLAALDVGLFGVGSQTGADLERTDRAGDVAPVRYRSPLTTPSVTPDPDDPDDVTLLAARNLGRLLAAADGRVVAELVRLRQTRLTRAALAVTRSFGVAPRPAAAAAPVVAPSRAAASVVAPSSVPASVAPASITAERPLARALEHLVRRAATDRTSIAAARTARPVRLVPRAGAGGRQS